MIGEDLVLPTLSKRRPTSVDLDLEQSRQLIDDDQSQLQSSLNNKPDIIFQEQKRISRNSLVLAAATEEKLLEWLVSTDGSICINFQITLLLMTFFLPIECLQTR